ncbi:nucleotidyltransferase family protein [Candidatus Woesearchaeota archaeon]|nr:nucleotidyltransferase family protein [Candidatus Woesearchaeota archaeon]
MKAIILCAGYATRLYPLTKHTPKPLLPIKGKPIVELIIKQLENLAKKGELDEIIIVTNNKFAETFTKWAESFDSPTTIAIVNDGTTSNDDRLGAVGDLLFAVKNQQINDDVFLLAGDNLFETNLEEMADIAKNKHASVIATYDLKDPQLLANKFGVVQIDETNKILTFEEKPANPKSSLTATAVYLIKKDDLHKIKDLVAENKRLDNMGEMIIFLTKVSEVYTRPIDNWIDIGSLEDYKKANEK